MDNAVVRYRLSVTEEGLAEAQMNIYYTQYRLKILSQKIQNMIGARTIKEIKRLQDLYRVQTLKNKDIYVRQEKASGLDSI